jgi:hypothetical protein
MRQPSRKNSLPGVRHEKLQVRERRRIIMCNTSTPKLLQGWKLLKLPRSVVKYWVMKFKDPHYHNAALGGSRRGIFH